MTRSTLLAVIALSACLALPAALPAGAQPRLNSAGSAGERPVTNVKKKNYVARRAVAVGPRGGVAVRGGACGRYGCAGRGAYRGPYGGGGYYRGAIRY